MLDVKRRAEIERLLWLRGRLLAPRQEVIKRALRRCAIHAAQEDHDEGWQGPQDEQDIDTKSDSTAAVSGSVSAALPAQGTGTMDLPSDEEQRIASAVAEAVTVSEEAPVDDFDFAQESTVAGRIIPSIIRQGKNKIKGLGCGSVIKGYRIEGILGIGGMGQVYKALQISLHRRVAFKILAPRLAKNPDFRQRFFREARNAGQLQHPNLIAVHDVEEAEGLLFFSMELVEGKSLKQIIKSEGVFSQERSLMIVRQCLKALEYAHDKGLIHRDIKPDNIMLTAMDQVKVADLGLSRLDTSEEANPGVSNKKEVMGTPHYMAPEQSRSPHDVDRRVDLYALGATLYHMLCGKVPFEGTSAMDVLLRSATQPLVFPEDIEVSPAMRTFISALMEKDPDNRPTDARQALQMLDRLFLREAHLRRSYHSQISVLRRYSWVIALVLALLVALVVLFAVQRGDESQTWRHFSQEMSQLTSHHRYAQALQHLEAYRQTAPERFDDSLNGMQEDITQAWDSYTREQYGNLLDNFDELLFHQEHERLQREISMFRQDPAKCSPYVEQRLQEILSALEEQ